MSYVIFGRRQQAGRAASHTTIEAALAELCRMKRDGYVGLEVKRELQPAEPAAAFLALHARSLGEVCSRCSASCDSRCPG